MEHRWGRRVSLQIPVRLITDAGHIVPGAIENISISGALIRVSHPVSSWTRMELELVPPAELAAVPLRLEAHVTRATRYGAAVEWSELAPQGVRELLLATEAFRPSRTSTGASPHRHRDPHPHTLALAKPSAAGERARLAR